MFYGSFGAQNTMVAFISKFDPRKGEYEVKLGQKRSNFENKKLLKHAYLVQFCLKIPKMLLIFTYGNLKCQKIIKKVTSSPLPVFYHCTAKCKGYCFEIWYVCCLYVGLQYTFGFVG